VPLKAVCKKRAEGGSGRVVSGRKEREKEKKNLGGWYSSWGEQGKRDLRGLKASYRKKTVVGLTLGGFSKEGRKNGCRKS